MMKKLKTSKGITLIALVITIIVLLILAGVAISMLSGDNGILKQAADAKTDTEQETVAEQVKLAAMAALTAGEGKVDLSVLKTELAKIDGYEEEEINKLPATVTIGENSYTIAENGTIEKEENLPTIQAGEYASTKSKYVDGNKIAIIPEGFTVSNVKTDTVDETTIKSGLVIYKGDLSKETDMSNCKETNDQFVWIPVEDAIYSSKNASKIPTSSTNGSKTGYDYTPMGIQVDGEYKGLLYDFNSTGGAYLKYPSATNYQGDENNYREPAYLANTSYADGSSYNTVGITESSLQKEYKEMLESVEKYGGFYVGRYETSLNDAGNAQIKSGHKAATAENSEEETWYGEYWGCANTWYGLYQKQKEYSSKNNLTNIVGSTMIWGSQYDQMMIWMQKNDIDVTGNIGDNRNLGTTDPNGEKIVGTTGTTPTDKINNIYDLYGNGYEWTLEAYNTSYRVYRGGICYNSLSPSYRGGGNPFITFSGDSSRASLYIK